MTAPRAIPDSDPPRTVLIALAGLAVGILGPLVILVAPGRPLTLVGVLAFALFGFGPAITSWLDTGEPFAQLALTVVLSLAAYVIAATCLIWWRLWHPDLLLVLAIPTVISCLGRIGVWRQWPVAARPHHTP